jgi:gluconate 5-dehydrogenase
MTAKRFELNGKQAIVAGESPFWSKYIAAALAKAGADVAIIGKKSTRIDAALNEVKQTGRTAFAAVADVTSAAQVKTAVEKIHSQSGKIDILVNVADIRLGTPFLDTSENEWQSVMTGNLMSAINTCKAVGPVMLARKHGRIINLVSCLAERGMPNSSAYCVAMGGVLQLTRALSLEWALEGITVNAIGTGWFKEDKKEAFNEADPLARYIPAKHFGLPDDIAPVVVYLASDATSFTTGQFMYVDGALMAHA